MDKIKASTLADLAYYSRFKPPSRLITFAAPASTLTNFPALVKCNSTFNIGTSTGYDVHFQDLAGNELYFDLDFYDPVTGNGAWWVQIPSLPSTGPTSIKMLYGDSSVTTNGSTPATVWADYAYVYHFNDVDDLSSVIGTYTPTNTGNVSAALSLVSNAMTGRGMRFWVTDGYGSRTFSLRVGSAINTSAGTISILASTDVIGKSDRAIHMNTGWREYRYYIDGTTFYTKASSVYMSMTRSEANGFYCYGGSTNASEIGWSVNGVIQDASSGTPGSLRWDSPSIQITGHTSNPTEIIFDEIRISSTTYKSSAWLQYEQNLMMNHGSYVNYGPEA